MRRFQGCLAVVVLLTASPLLAQSKAKAQNVPEIPYDSAPNFLKLPDNLYMGEGIGVATNSKGHVFVYTRSARDAAVRVRPERAPIVKEIGEGLYGFLFAHAVRVDKDDNIWAVDEGINMVIKFNPKGKVLMLLGRRPESVEGLEETPPDGHAAAQRAAVRARPSDRRRLGPAGQHLRLRRLRATRASSSTTSGASSSSRSARAAPRRAS